MVSGDLYAKQGAGFPVDVIVIRPISTVPMVEKIPMPWQREPRRFDTWKEIRDVFFVADRGLPADRMGAGWDDDSGSDTTENDQADMGSVSGADASTADVGNSSILNDIRRAGSRSLGEGANDVRPTRPKQNPSEPSDTSVSATTGSRPSEVSNGGNAESGNDRPNSGNGSGNVADRTATGDVQPGLAPQSQKPVIDTQSEALLQELLDKFAADESGSMQPLDKDKVNVAVRLVKAAVQNQGIRAFRGLVKWLKSTGRVVDRFVSMLARYIKAAWGVARATNTQFALDKAGDLEVTWNEPEEAPIDPEKTDFQVTYRPRALNRKSVNTLLPVNMADAVYDALNDIEVEFGPVNNSFKRNFGTVQMKWGGSGFRPNRSTRLRWP